MNQSTNKNPNPKHSHIAIGENGNEPPIIIYEWPSLEIVCVLKNAAQKRISYLAYSPDGTLLASHSGKPDFLITIYEWEELNILLRIKSHDDEVYRLMFSPTVPGHLISCGIHHIKFWKITKTFSGLKLVEQPGRFSATEYCTILGICPMPDQKVVSGCEWGNILIWENGLIKVEVSRHHDKKCHDASITEFLYSNNDLWSIGMDGWIKIWYYKHFDQTDVSDENRVLQIEPSYQFHIPEIMFMSVHKQNDDPTNTLYFAQDGNGGIWHIDLNIKANTKAPVQLYKCHAGAIADIATCPWGPYLVSLGFDGRLHIYQYEEQKLLFVHQYPAKGSSIIWLPLTLQQSGDQLIMGFDDGNLRAVILSIPDNTSNITSTTIQVTKPHHRLIKTLTLNNAGSLLATSSEDTTIFIYQLKAETNSYTVMIPIGYVSVSETVTCLAWHQKYETTILVGCVDSHFIQVNVPAEPQKYTTTSYKLKVDLKQYDIALRESHGEKKMKKQQVASKEEAVDISNRIVWIQTTAEDTVWLSVSNCNTGYIYEYFLNQSTDMQSCFQTICSTNNVEINSFLYNHDKSYLMFAMRDGNIRVIKTNPNNTTDLSNYWQLAMHDNHNGFIPRMGFSYDEKYFFTCGHDGNIFSYKFHPEEEYGVITTTKSPMYTTPTEVEDVNGYTNLSLEETKIKRKTDRTQQDFNKNKQTLLYKLDILKKRFQEVLQRNEQLKPSQVIPRKKFEVDARITTHLNETLSNNLELIERQLAFDVEKSRLGMEKLKHHFTDAVDIFPICVRGVQTQIYLTNTRQRKLTDTFYEMMNTVAKKLAKEELKVKWEESIIVPERPIIVQKIVPPTEKEEKQLEQFLNGLSLSTIQSKFGPKLTQLLHKYETHKMKIIKRQQEWNTINALKPTKALNNSNDEAILNQAKETVGDYKLKSSHKYKIPRHLWESTVKKYKQLLDVRLRQYHMRHNFNLKVYNLREKRVRLCNYLRQLNTELDRIQCDLEEKYLKKKPFIPEITDDDFPEKNLEVKVVLPEFEGKENGNKGIIQPPNGDLLEKEILTSPNQTENIDENVKESLSINFNSDDTHEDVDVLSQCQEIETQYEKYVRNYRQSRKLFEQNVILKKIQKAIQAFDKEVDKLAQEKLQVTRDADFLDLHLLTLHQELYILKDSADAEEKLQEKLHHQMRALINVNNVIDQTNNKINEHRVKINQLQDEVKSIQYKFTTATANDRFSNYFLKLFRKKQTTSNELSSSTETLTSNSQQNDVENSNALDENICPKNCNRSLYNMTLELRSKRHATETEIKNQNSITEMLQKELNRSFDNVDVIVDNLKQSRAEMDYFQKEKQNKSNQVMCTVILKLHQLQHLDKNSHITKIGDTLLFSKPTLSKLYKRVGHLHNETLLQKAKQKVNTTHLTRMRTDCRHMERILLELKAEIVQKMKVKFGQEVNLDELQEAQLTNMVFDLRMSKIDIKYLYEHELKLWKEKYETKQTELKQTIKENTARLKLLATVNHEKAELIKLVAHQTKKKEHLESVSDITITFKKEIENLSEIIKNQTKEMQVLQENIKRLSLKGLPTTKQQPSEKLKEEEEEPTEFQWKDWSYEVLQKHSAQLPKKTKKGNIRIEWETEEEAEDEDEEDEEGSRTFTTEVQIPPVLPDEAEDMAKTLIIKMLNFLEIYQDFSTFALESLAEQILHDILGIITVNKIIEKLVAFLPEDATEEQQNCIKTTAEELLALQESETEHKDVWKTEKEILNDIIDDVLLSHETPQEIMATLLSELIEQLPTDFLLQQDIIKTIAEKVQLQFSFDESNKEELIQTVSNIASNKSDETRIIFNKILAAIFDTNTDHL